MSKVALFIIDGFEETEALTTVDILRRGDVDVTIVSLVSSNMVIGKNRVVVKADAMFSDVKDKAYDMIVIPGGTVAYTEHEGLLALVKKYNTAGGKIGAICAAPAVLGKAGILGGKKAVCYPGMESWLAGAVTADSPVVTDGNITTAKGPAITMCFALELLRILKGEETAEKVSGEFLVPLLACSC